MGTPHTVDVCKNCGEPVIHYNNTGAWKHYPEPHPSNGTATDCILPVVTNKTRSVAGVITAAKTAVRKSV